MNIVIEGIDGCGKTTVCKSLAVSVQQRNPQHIVELVSFPDRGTQCGQLIDDFLKMPRELHGKLSAYYHQALHTVNKLELLPVLLSERKINILSRYTPSAYVYGVLDGVDVSWLNRVNSVLPEPDLCVLLDIDPKVAYDRIKDRKDNDGYETMDLEWFQRCAEEYRKLWPQFDTNVKNPGSFYITQGKTTYVVINPQFFDGPEDVADRIHRIMNNYLLRR